MGSVFASTFSDSNTMVIGLLIFLAAGTLAFSVMAALRVRSSVKKRTARIMNDAVIRAPCSIRGREPSPSSSTTPTSTMGRPTTRT